MKKLGGILILAVLAWASSGCAPYPYYYGYGYTYRPAPPPRPVIRVCPRYPHWHRHPGGGWIIHRPHAALRTAPDQIPSRTMPRSAYKTLTPDWGPAASQPASAPTQEERLVKMERQLRAVGKATGAIYGIVQRFQFNDQPGAAPPQPPPAPAPDDE